MSININSNGTQLFNELESLDSRITDLENGQSGGGSTGIVDVPMSLGEVYCIRKAYEAVYISQYMRNALKVPGANKSAGDTFTGIPYSSTRVEDTLVPTNVSYETYITALSDGNSYAYTKSPGLGGYGYLYYGVVCGVFACWCLGIKNIRHTNWDMFNIPGLERISDQSAQAMKVGYIVNCAKNSITHAKVCVGVERNGDTVTKIILAESVDPVCRIVEYTASAFNSTLNNYTILKYNYLDRNTYDDKNSPYITVFCNKNIMPKKGNKSNWSTDEDVIIDVMDAASYTSYVLYKNGVVASTTELSGNTINLGHLGYGKYRLSLTDGTNESAPVEWIVVDMQMAAEPLSGGIVKFTFSSANATALTAQWCRADYMANLVYDIDEEDRDKGYIETSLSHEHNQCYGVTGYDGQGSQYEKYHDYYAVSNNPIYPRMTFETEYGIIKTTQWNTPIYYTE